MDERSMQFRVGLFVVVTVLIGAIMVVLFGELPILTNSGYTMHFRFIEAPGVSANTPIRKSGILVGRVNSVDFDDTGKVIVAATLNKSFQLRRNETIRITNSILGDAELQVVLIPVVAVQGAPSPNEPREHNELVEGQVASNPLNMLGNIEQDVTRTVVSLGQAGDKIGLLAGSLNERFDQNRDKFDSIVTNAEKSLVGVSKALKAVEDIMQDDQLRQDLRKSIHEIPLIISTTKEAISGLQSAMQGIDQNVKNLEGLTKPLGERGDEIVGNIDTSILKLNNLLGEVEKFSHNLNTSQGTVGQLLNNPDLYHQLNEAAANINEVTRRMKPIVEDARVLTDRVSRHPGVILRDAVKPGNGTKWSTSSNQPYSMNSASNYGTPAGYSSEEVLEPSWQPEQVQEMSVIQRQQGASLAWGKSQSRNQIQAGQNQQVQYQQPLNSVNQARNIPSAAPQPRMNSSPGAQGQYQAPYYYERR